MAFVSEVKLSAEGDDGTVVGVLRIALLPRIDVGKGYLRKVEISETALAGVQLVEGHEYLYEWSDVDGKALDVRVEPTELFQPDTPTGQRGRVRPGQSTGLLKVRIQIPAGRQGYLELEIRSTKLAYLTEYRWMLRDIAERMSELVMSRFAATGISFSIDPGRDAATLYQRFAFLQALLSSESFENAISEVIRRPHVAWEAEQEESSTRRALRANSHVVRQLSRGGPRILCAVGSIESLPETILSNRTEATRNTTPNRFVRFALKRWQEVVSDIAQRLAQLEPTSPIRRGQADVAETLERLDRLLELDLFRELGPLNRFPVEDQVLQRRAGYRDVFRAYLEFELAARLSWSANEETYFAGQRDVAALYEYWAFIQLAEIVSGLVGRSFDLAPLIEATPDGLNLLLKKRRTQVLSGQVEREGRQLQIELYFNHTFSLAKHSAWTRTMRPDYSLVIRPADYEGRQDPVVLHFDAKYRVEFIDELFGVDDGVAVGAETDSSSTQPLRDDLLKMHTYRDAIRRTAGAFVLYPGKGSELAFREYHELLPGLGAFVFRPSNDGGVHGGDALRKFISDVLDHVARRLTRHERGRHLLSESYTCYELDDLRAVPLAEETPSDDTTVLLGLVKDEDHWHWIRDRGAYNVRDEGRAGGLPGSAGLLFSRLLLMYGPTIGVVLVRISSDPEFVSNSSMAAAGYSSPRGDYWCIQIAPTRPQQELTTLSFDAVSRFADGRSGVPGAPIGVQWKDLRRLGAKTEL